MRIKCEFVTNSSSVSFVVMGARIGESEVKKLEGIDDTSSVSFMVMGAKIGESEVKKLEGIDDISSVLEDVIDGNDLSFSFGREYDDGFYIGIKYTNMHDDETLAEFKERVKNQIKDNLGIEKDPVHIEVCWEDR